MAVTMLEAMAKAAYEADGDAGIRKPPWSSLQGYKDHPIRVRYLKQQTAALKVLREPTEEMRDKGRSAFAFGDLPLVDEVWAAMIDAVLAEVP